MPIVEIKLLEGRDEEKKQKMVKNVTEAIQSSIGCPIEDIVVIITEMKKAHYAEGGVLYSKKQHNV